MDLSKKCYACGETKKLSEFYSHRKSRDGTVNKCKECTKKDVRENRKRNIEHYREYDKRRAMLPKRVKMREDYAKTDDGKKAIKRASNRYRAKHPRRRAAHIAVGNAIRDGHLIPQPCEICGETNNVHAHHDDYSKQLDVRWLCASHHKQWHIEHGEAKNG